MDIVFIKENVAQLNNQIHQVHKSLYKLWLDYQFLTWRWWITVGLLIIPCLLWLILRKRNSTFQMLTVYLLVTLIANVLDSIGINSGLWSYPITIFPFTSCAVAFNFSALPITTLFFLQYVPKVKPLIKALVYSLTGSFIFQPAMQYLGLVNHEKWLDYYSFPILFCIYLASDWLAKRTQYTPIKS